MAVEVGRIAAGGGHTRAGTTTDATRITGATATNPIALHLGERAEPAPAQPAEPDPARHEPQADQARRDELGRAARVGEHRAQAAFVRRVETSATIATIRPIRPTRIPIRPKVFALEASSAAACASACASPIALASRGSTRSIRSASSPLVGCWSGNSTDCGLSTSSNVLGPDVKVSSTFSPSTVPDEMERVLSGARRDQPRAVVPGVALTFPEERFERQRRRRVAERDLDVQRVAEVHDRLPVVDEEHLDAVHLTRERGLGAPPHLHLEVAELPRLVREGGCRREQHERPDEGGGRQGPFRSFPHDEPPTFRHGVRAVRADVLDEGTSGGGWCSNAARRGEQRGVGSSCRDRQGEHHADAGRPGAGRDHGREPRRRPGEQPQDPRRDDRDDDLHRDPRDQDVVVRRDHRAARRTRDAPAPPAPRTRSVWATTRTLASRPNRSAPRRPGGRTRGPRPRPSRRHQHQDGLIERGEVRVARALQGEHALMWVRDRRSGTRAHARAPARPRPCRRSGSLGAWVPSRTPTDSSVRLGWIVRWRPDEAARQDERGAMRAEDVRTVGVIGCGLMGSGIAEVVARAGQHAVVLETSDELVERGPATDRDLDAPRGRTREARRRGARGGARTHLADDGRAGPGRRRPRDRGRDRGSRHQGRDVPPPRRGHQARGDPREQHVVDPDRRPGRRDVASRQGARDALLQPGPRDGAHRARQGISTPTTRWRSDVAYGVCSARRPSSRATAPASS